MFITRGIEDDIEEYVNLKHMIQDMINQKVISLQKTPPNITINMLPNYGRVVIKVIKTNKELLVSKYMVSASPKETNNIEKIVATLNIGKMTQFSILMTPHHLK